VLFAGLIIGVMGGIIGAIFIKVNNIININRKKYLLKKWMKVLEAVFIAFITASVFYVATISRYDAADTIDNNICIDNSVIEKKKEYIHGKQFLCKDG
jgi:H+/Cl- antiporter ClcA